MKNRLKDKTILIADDETVVRDTIGELLELQGAKVLRAADGQEAWDLVQRHTSMIDAVVTDFKMPNLTGFEFLQLVRKAGIDLPFIFITGFSSEPHESLIQAGACSVLTKPFKLEVLVQAIEDAWLTPK